jgi:hypothetical protein
MFKLEINRHWGLTAARAWAHLLVDRIRILLLVFDDGMELEAQARQGQFYCSRSVRNSLGIEHRPNGRG